MSDPIVKISAPKEETSPRKKCRVCGNDTVRCAFNYNGLCCESCKSFFRRNAFNHQTLVCKLNNQCEISFTTRRFCSACRMQKCFGIGMSTNYFRNSPNNPRNITINNNRPTDQEEEEGETEVQSQPNRNLHTEVYRLPTDIAYYRHCLETFKASLALVMARSPLTYRREVAGDVGTIRELFPHGKEKRFVHQLVEYGQSLDGFSELNRADKTALLGQSFSEVLLLRSACNFNFERDSLVVLVDGDANVSVYSKLGVFYGAVRLLCRLHRMIARRVKELMSDDNVVRELTVVLQMLQPNRYRLTLRPESIHYLYTRYSTILRLYLTEKFGVESGLERHRLLLELIDCRSGPLKSFIEKINSRISELPDRENFQQYLISLV